MVDKDPIARWTFGRITFAGDAAHPMYPRGSNGAAQALIDARTLADLLGRQSDRGASPRRIRDDARRETTAKIVRTNREHPPDFINIRVEELTGDKPYDNLDDIHHPGRVEDAQRQLQTRRGLCGRGRGLVETSVSSLSSWPGQGPAIHEFVPKTWMPGTRPGMTAIFRVVFVTATAA